MLNLKYLNILYYISIILLYSVYYIDMQIIFFFKFTYAIILINKEEEKIKIKIFKLYTHPLSISHSKRLLVSTVFAGLQI